MTKDLALIEIKKEQALEIFTAEKGLDAYLLPLKKLVDEFKGDASTEKGRKEIGSFCYSLARSKTHLDNIGKNLVAEMKKTPKLIDAERKRMRDLIDLWSKECAQPLTEYKRREQDRIDGIKSRLQLIQSAIDQMGVCTDSEVLLNIKRNYNNLKDFDAQEFIDKQTELLSSFKSTFKLREDAIKVLDTERLAKAEKDAQQREINLKIAAERAKAEAKESRAEAERQKKINEQQQEEQKEQKEDIEKKQTLIEEYKRAARLEESELEKIAAEKERSKQTEHRNMILLQILEDMKTHADEETAKTITRAIIKGQIRNLLIKY